MVLWQYPLAFASDTVPMDLTDREELSRALVDTPAGEYMAVRAVGAGAGLGDEIRLAVPGDEEGDFTKVEFQESMPEISTHYNVRTGLRKLSNSQRSQRKRVLQGLHELVAADEVLKSLCKNATLRLPHAF